MYQLSLRARFEDHITFGAGYVPFLALLIPVFFPFVFGLIRFQDVRAPYGPLSPTLYIGITIVSFVIIYLLLRQVGRWTFAPSLHRRTNIILTMGTYVGVVLGMVFVGYLITNPRFEAISRLGISDAIVGLTVASVYVAVVSAVILRQDLAGLFDQPQERFRDIEDWIEALDEAKDVDARGESQARVYEQLVEKSEELLDELEEARTNEGEQLRYAFDEWLTDFRGRDSSISREAILTGRTENDRLLDRYQKLTWIQRQVTDIGGDEVGKISIDR